MKTANQKLAAELTLVASAILAVAIGGMVIQSHKPRAVYRMAGEGPAHTQTFIANVSAYCPCELCCGVYADGVTASGHVIQPGDKFVAAPKHIPFGTVLIIPGYGEVEVLDRGGAIKGNKLDIFFATHKEALQWGRQQIAVKVVQ